MTLKEIRNLVEGKMNVNLIHQSSENNNNVYVLLDHYDIVLSVKVVVYFVRNGKWEFKNLYFGNDYVCGMQEFQKALKENVSDPLDNLVFVCPDCGGNRIECLLDGHHLTFIDAVDDGELDYGITISNGTVENFQCSCGWVIKDKDGYPIVDDMELIDWIKNNC